MTFEPSSRRFSARPVTLALLGSFSLAGCADFARGEPLPDAAAADTSLADAGASFTTVHDVLLSGCRRCHATGAEAGDTQFLLTGDVAMDRTVTVRFVDVTTPTASPLLAKASGPGHAGGTVYGINTSEYLRILNWIQEGAKP